MKIIDRITFTGIDHTVSYEDISRFLMDNPIVEFGVLFHQKDGRSRYPNKEWRMGLYDHLNGISNSNLSLEPWNLSAHLCGDYVDEFWDSRFISEELDLFKRVQLNVNFSRLSILGQTCLINKVHSGYPLRPRENESIITQHNDNNKLLTEFLCQESLKHHHVLFDASGGRGTIIERFPPNIPNRYCGFAGGITPENVETIVTNLLTKGEISSKDTPTNIWIDMESGVRTDSKFDLDKCRQVVQKVAAVQKRLTKYQ